jgi:hypothetical protein
MKQIMQCVCVAIGVLGLVRLPSGENATVVIRASCTRRHDRSSREAQAQSLTSAAELAASSLEPSGEKANILIY